MALVFQWAPFLSSTVRECLARASPEPLLLAFGVGSAALVFAAWRGACLRSSAVGLGLLSGLGLILKITFLPLVVGSVLIFRKPVHWALYAASVAAAVLFYVLHPLMNPQRFLWFGGLLVRREGYNAPLHAGAGLAEDMLDRAQQLFGALARNDAGVLVFLAIFFALTPAIFWIWRRREAFRVQGYRDVWIALALTFLGQILLVSAGPAGQAHYMVPALGMLGLAWLLVIQVLRDCEGRNGRKAVLRSACALGVALVLAACLQAVGEVRTASEDQREWRKCYDFLVARMQPQLPVVDY